MAPTEPMCTREGLAAVFGFDRLGAYDGADGWLLMIRNLPGQDQRSMTETHEALHHDLQWSSGWGLLSSGVQVLARRGFRPYAFRELFLLLVEHARNTHETYATTFSAMAGDFEQARRLLAGNQQYLAYLDRGLGLVDAADGVPWQFRSAAISSVLRVCMRPAATLNLLQQGLRTLRPADVEWERDAPDTRLDAYERASGPASWQPLFDGLAAEFPDRGGDVEHARRAMPVDSPEFDRLRRFEEEILMPRCHAHACTILDGVGLPSIGSRQQSTLATVFQAAVHDADPGFAAQLELVRERRPLHEEALEYHRQRIWLRDHLPAEVTTPEETRRTTNLFRSAGGGAGFVCGLWIDRQVARGQFDLEEDVPNPLVAIAAVDDIPNRLRLGLLPDSTTPVACQAMLDGSPLVVITTHHTLARHADVLAVLQTVEPVYVLMDLPVNRHIKQWIDGGIVVRMAQVELGALLPEHAGMALLVFAVTRNHPFRFLCLGADGAIAVLADQMRRRYPEKITDDVSLIEEYRPATMAAVQFVLESWHLLQQGGYTPSASGPRR